MNESYFSLPQGLLSSISGRAPAAGYSDPYVNNVGLFTQNMPGQATPQGQVGQTGQGSITQGMFSDYLPDYLRRITGSSGTREPSAWESMSDAEQARYYAENPMMANLTQTAQGLWSTLDPWYLATIQNKLFPEFVSRQQQIAQGINPETGAPANYGNWDYTGFSGQSGLGVDGTTGEAEAAANLSNPAVQAAIQSSTPTITPAMIAAAIAEGDGYDSESTPASVYTSSFYSPSSYDSTPASTYQSSFYSPSYSYSSSSDSSD